jgi:hypothetical protein
MRPVVWTLIEIAKVGIGGNDSRHRTDIKTKQASSNHCHCSDTVAMKLVKWLGCTGLQLPPAQSAERRSCSHDLHVNVADLITHFEGVC